MENEIIPWWEFLEKNVEKERGSNGGLKKILLFLIFCAIVLTIFL